MEGIRDSLGTIARYLKRRDLSRRANRVRVSDEDRPPLWLFGAFAGARFGDNSAALFRYVVENLPEVDARWVMQLAAPDWERAASIGPVVAHDLPKTYALARTAEMLAISHGVHDIPEMGTDRVTGLTVRLGHGLTALKATGTTLGRSVARTMGRFDLVPVASEFERDIKRSWGVRDDAIAITGLCRFDELGRLAREALKEPGKVVLYVPTWREHLNSARNSTFVKAVSAFHTDPLLTGALDETDASIVTSLHPLIPSTAAEAIRDAAPDRVTVLEGSMDLQPVLATCDLLVTDYSSVTWDALYLDKPVILFQFDRDLQHRSRPSYLPPEWGQPGHVAEKPDDAARVVSDFLRDGIEPLSRKERQHWRGRVFAFDDERNCERVVEEICQRLPTSRNGI